MQQGSERRKKWEEFMKEFPEHFMTDEEIWDSNLHKLREFMIEKKKRPIQKSKDKDEKFLGKWLSHQTTNYKKFKYGMKEGSERRKKWEEFMKEFPEHFKGIDVQFLREEQELENENNTNQSEQELENEFDNVVNETAIISEKECEKECVQKCNCGNKKQSEKGEYRPSDPEMKKIVNNWLGSIDYEKNSKAIFLDANIEGNVMLTANSLLDNEKFDIDDMVIPEIDEVTYKKHFKHYLFGDCVQKGDFMDILKSIDINEFGLIYADFMGHANTCVIPLLEYISEKKSEMKKDVIIGITWTVMCSGTEQNRINNNFKVVELLTNINVDYLYLPGYEDNEIVPYGNQMRVCFFKLKK